METSMRYADLIKPLWAPPSWVFGPVWTVLYVLIAISFGTVFYQTLRGKLSWNIALPFALNLVTNFAFTPIQFGLNNNFLASVDIALVVGTLIWALTALWREAPKLRFVVYLNIPYLLWGMFALCLQFTITFLNW